MLLATIMCRHLSGTLKTLYQDRERIPLYSLPEFIFGRYRVLPVRFTPDSEKIGYFLNVHGPLPTRKLSQICLPLDFEEHIIMRAMEELL